MSISLKNNGFTLIELIIVIAILGILAVAALVALNPLAQFQKANDVRRKSDLAQVQRALETYYQDNNRYPVGTDTYQISGVSWGNGWQPYMNLLPTYPSSSNHYAYYSPTGQSYYIYASLDRVGSSELCKGNSSDSSNPCNKKACGGTCNFGVSSPDVSP